MAIEAGDGGLAIFIGDNADRLRVDTEGLAQPLAQPRAPHDEAAAVQRETETGRLCLLGRAKQTMEGPCLLIPDVQSIEP